MSIIYKDSELKPQQRYVVQDVSKLSRDTKRFVGLPGIFLGVSGSTASVRLTNNMHKVPVRALINVVGYKAKSVRGDNADGFVVIARNPLGIPVGRAYLDPVNVTETDAIFVIDDKELKIPLSILASLVKIKPKVQKEHKKTDPSPESPVDSLPVVDNSTQQEDHLEVPPIIRNLLPDVDFAAVRSSVCKKPGEYSDYEYNLHPTIEEADKANALIQKRMFEKELLGEAEAELSKSFEKIRSKNQ